MAIARKIMLGGETLWTNYTATSNGGGEGRPSDDITGDGHLGFRDANHPTVSDGEMWMRRSYRDRIAAYGWQPTRIGIMYNTLTSWDGASPAGTYVASGPNLALRLSEDGGYNFLLVDTHGGNDVWAFEGDYFRSSHANSLTGAANFVYTGACLTGGFDAGEPCLSEAMLRCPTGGALVYLGCSRYGWGSVDANPADNTSAGGASSEYMRYWLEEVFSKKNLETGVAFFNHKSRMIGWSGYNGTYRWIQFGLNLQGEPLLKMIGVQPFVSVTATKTVQAEGESGTVTFTISRSGAAIDTPLTVNYTRSGGAAAGSDYTTSPTLATSGSLTIPAGSASTTVTLTVVNDTAVESDESVIIALTAGTGYMVDSKGSAVLTIVDNDGSTQPTVQMAVVDSVAREQGPDPGVVRVWRTGGSSTAITVPYTIAGTVGNGTDYAALSGSVSLGVNVASVDVVVLPIDDTVGDIGETVVLTAQAGTGYSLGALTGGTLTIEDNDMTVTVAAQDGAASEPGRGEANGNFRFSRSGATSAPATIHYTVSGTASPGSDYTSLAGTVTFAANQASVDVAVVPKDDTLSEPRESVVVTLIPDPGNPIAYSIGTPGAATVYLHDDDLPVIAVETTTTNTFTETDGGKTAWTLRRIKGNQNVAISVLYAMGGAAVNEVDYAKLLGTATIGGNGSAETTSVNVSVDPTDDAVCEGPETATLTLVADAAYAIDAAAAGTITINDNDKPKVAIATAPAQVVEGASGTFTVTRSDDVQLSQVTVLYTVTGTATLLADYSALAGSVIIPEGETSASFTLATLADAIPEIGETVIATIATNSAYTVLAAPSNAATITIIDDNETPLVTVTWVDNYAAEPAKTEGAGVFRFWRAGARGSAITVNYVVGGSATAGSDYQTLAGSVIIPAGSDYVDVAVNALDDSEAEPDETVTVTVAAGVGYDVGTPVSASVTIYDDEAPQLYVTVYDSTCKEGTTDTGKFRLWRLGDRGIALSATYTIAGSATNGTDYASIASPISLSPGTTSTDITVSAELKNDSLVEGSESVVLTLTANGYALASPSSATLYILDDETVDVSVSAQDGTATEGTTDKGMFRITRSATAATSLSVRYTVSGTATPGADYASLGGTAIIPANATIVDVPVDASTFNDGMLEGPESVIMTLDYNNAINLYDIGTGTATVIIRDDETPTVTLAATDSTATEEGDTGTFTITCTPAPVGNLTVNLAIGGSATAGADYAALSTSVVVLSGQTTATVTVNPIDDDLYEGTGGETVQLTLAAGAYNIGTTGAQTVTIGDAGDRPVITVLAIDGSASEAGPTTGKFLVLASKAANADYSVVYTVGGTATAVSDYASIGASKQINRNTFQAEIVVTPVNDAVGEGPESVVLTAVADAKYVLGSPVAATVTIADDDASSPGVLAFSSAAYSVAEGDSGSTLATITVSRSGGSTGAVSVPYATASGTATAGGDYTATSGTLTWADGEAGDRTFTVSVNGDGLDEPDETVNLSLGSATGGATLGTAAAVLTILDDDAAGIVVGAISGQTTEGGGTATFTVVLGSQPTANVTIALSSDDVGEGTVSPLSLSFGSGDWSTAKTVTVTGVDDALADGAITYHIVTAAASSADPAYSGLNAADVTVVNADDAVELTVAAGAGGTVSPSGTVQADPDADTPVAATASTGYHFVDWTGTTTGMASTTSASTTIRPVGAQSIQANFAANTVAIVASPASLTVPEGATATFSVVLSAQPAAAVTVAVARTAGDTDISVSSGASRTFTTANWNVAQTVTLAAAEDNADQAAGTATFSCSATGLATVTVTATEADDDHSLAISAVHGTVSRDPATALYDHGSSVELTAVPAIGYHFTGWSGALGGTANPASLVMDADKAVTANFAANAVVIETSPATVAVPEGGSATFRLRLGAQPAANVTVALAIAGDADLAIASAASLVFTTDNWGSYQTVTLSAAEDNADQAAGSATISCTADGLDTVTVTANEVDDDHLLTLNASNGSITASPATALYDHGVSVTLTAVPAAGYHFTGWSGALGGSANPATLAMDADKTVTAAFAANVVAVQVDAATVSVPEGGTAGFQVRLSAQPAAAVTVNVARTSGDADVSVSAGTVLTFTTSNWQTWQGVTLAAAEDDADTLNGMAVITCDGGACGTATVQATEADNDQVNLVVDTTVVAVPEGGTAGFRLRLSRAPAADVVVTVGPTGGDASITVAAGASLTFTSADWSSWKDVTLAAAEDDGDMLAGTTPITASAAGIDPLAVTANEVDDDHALAITATDGTVAKAPATAYHDHGSSVELTASPAAGYHFTGWSGALGGSANPALLLMDADKAVTAHFAANDVAIVVTASVVVPENGTATLAVRLSAQPSGPVTVTVTVVGDPDLVVQSGGTLVFDSDDWNIAQSAILAALDDADAQDGTATITCSAAGLTSVAVAASEDDDDAAALVLSLAQSAVGEAAGTVTATVSRNTATSGDLLVTLGSSLGAQATVPASVTIPAGAASATFSITVIDDVLVDGTQTTQISAAAPGHAAASAPLQIADNDAAGFTVAPASLHVAEGGGTATFTVVLTAKPLGDVRLLLSSSAPGEATVSPAVLFIDPATWDTPRTVTVTGVDDALLGAGTAIITITVDDAASADAFDALADQQVAVTCDDDETNHAPTITVVSPAGGVAAIRDGLGLCIDTTVSDDGLPGAPAVLAISWSQVSGPGSAFFDCLTCEDARVGFFGPGVYVLRLSVTDGQLGVTRDFTITVDDGRGTYPNLAPLVSAGSDAAGAVGSAIALAGSVSDDDQPSGMLTQTWSQVQGPGVAVFSAPSSAITNVTCPLAGTYLFRLTADDGAVRTCDEVQVTVSATHLLTVLNDGHCVTVPAGGTVQTTGAAVPITATPASGWHFAGWVVVSGPAIFADWQDASTTVTATADAVIRATCAINTYTLAYNAGAGGSVSGSALQTVTHGGSGTAVTAVPDTGHHFTGWSDGIASATRSDGPITADLAVIAGFAPNVVAILPEAATVAVTENGGRNLGVRLSAQPMGNVTVNVAHAAGDADLIIVSGAVLTFTSSDWNVPQTVTIGALDDADLVNGSAQVSLAAGGLATVLVTAVERDDDAPQSISIGSGNPGGGCGAGGLGLLLLALASLSLRRRVRAGGR